MVVLYQPGYFVMLTKRIVIEGNDGTGKTSLVHMLQRLGFSNVHDRGEISRATLDPSVQPAQNTTYIILTCAWETSKMRLECAGRDMTEEWHTDAALQKYHRAFLDLADKFKATVIESSFIRATLNQVLSVVGAAPYIGMPSGRLADKAARLPYPYHMTYDGRSLVRKLDNGITLLWARSQSYPQMVAHKSLDAAVVGSDVLMGNPYTAQVEVIQRWRQIGSRGQPIRVVVAGKAPDVRPTRHLLKVATPFPGWAQQYFGDRGVPHTIYAVSGGTESLVSAGVADVLFDISETGETLQANGLTVFEEVGPVDLCIIRRCR